MNDQRKPQEPVKIVLQDIQTKPLSNGYNAIIKGTGDMTKGKEYFSKWFATELQADTALETLAERQGCVVSIDKWHIKGNYQNWEEYTLLEDEEAPPPPTKQEKAQDRNSKISDAGDTAQECMAEAKKRFEEVYKDSLKSVDPIVLAAMIQAQQKWATSLFIAVTDR